MKIEEEDARYLRREIEGANAVLILGAGAVGGCLNAQSQPLKIGSALADLIARQAGFTYSGERLDMVIEAARLPVLKLNEILDREFKNCRPSQELGQLLSVPWYRLYTFNIDDSLEGVHPASGQTRYRY